MVCVFLLFCSLVVNNPTVPLYPGTVSRFDVPALTFLAHNTLDGQYFHDIVVGDVIDYYDGQDWYEYEVTEIRAMQAIDTDSPTTSLIWNGETLKPRQIYKQIYNVRDTLVLQTCIYKDGDSRWGRLFVIAKPITEKSP